MKKLLIVLVLILSALGIGYFAYRLGVAPLVSNDSTPSSVLHLIDLPHHYCPTTAQVVAVTGAKRLADSQLAVTNCTQINLARTVEGKNPDHLIVKLPKGLAFSLAWPASANQSLSYAPALGDVNHDNVIDATDSQSVTAALFTKSNLAGEDVDSDGAVTVADLVLVRLNQGVGVPHPGGEAWSL